jgi:protein-L-isoaspartate(D-aspartate) O-methyltransferase
VTDRDIAVRGCAEGANEAPIGAIMTRALVACRPGDDLARAEALMREHQTGRVLVIDGDGRAAGVISVADLALLEEAHAATTLRHVVVRDVHAELDAGMPRWAEHQIELRRNMVAGLARRGITDRAVLRALLDVPRELFLPAELAAHAYEDRPLPIGEGRTAPSPYGVALVAQALRPELPEKLLELGCGTGYATAIFACLAGSVIATEPDYALAQETAHRLRALGVANVRVCPGGAIPEERYDAIAISTPDVAIPTGLLEQLALGGRLVAAVGGRGLIRLTRTAESSYRRDVIAATPAAADAAP